MHYLSPIHRAAVLHLFLHTALSDYGWTRTDDGKLDISRTQAQINCILKGCKCKTGCVTRRCSCKKEGVTCGPGCHCLNCRITTDTHLEATSADAAELEVQELLDECLEDQYVDDSEDELIQEDDEADQIMNLVFGNDGDTDTKD